MGMFAPKPCNLVFLIHGNGYSPYSSTPRYSNLDPSDRVFFNLDVLSMNCQKHVNFILGLVVDPQTWAVKSWFWWSRRVGFGRSDTICTPRMQN